MTIDEAIEALKVTGVDVIYRAKLNQIAGWLVDIEGEKIVSLSEIFYISWETDDLFCSNFVLAQVFSFIKVSSKLDIAVQAILDLFEMTHKRGDISIPIYEAIFYFQYHGIIAEIDSALALNVYLPQEPQIDTNLPHIRYDFAMSADKWRDGATPLIIQVQDDGWLIVDKTQAFVEQPLHIPTLQAVVDTILAWHQVDLDKPSHLV